MFFCLKLDGRADGAVDSREKLLEFCFDYCYWSVDPADPHYASQEEVTASPAKHCWGSASVVAPRGQRHMLTAG